MNEAQVGDGRGPQGFQLPVLTLGLSISAMQHPRLDADPGCRWLRQKLLPPVSEEDSHVVSSSVRDERMML